ncbi:putative LRR receptor-like serine/threonine-protein kinase [Acorus calamus]|uniref:LRR receptor-like serine/threonine-protein kinase n=1 Tax=Acorus calamus TaxID=4465 RepID=A0AAV9DVH8_ACOCL|nr:putative LRR receptor-like serine/threonine-protein kinase [Acorus calamus]
MLPIDEQYLLERTWSLHERKELVLLVDTSLNGDFDAEEACRFLKIGLLCTQDSPKLRPSMSTILRLLTGENTIDDENITKPGLISDFMDLKVRSQEKAEKINTSVCTDTVCELNSSSSSSANNTTFVSLSFTEIQDRSI